MKYVRVIPITALVLLIAAACSTVPPGPSFSPETLNTVALFETGSVVEIVAYCSVPLLFDREILVRESDIRQLVETLVATTEQFRPVGLNESENVSTLAPFFGTSFEVEAFLERYVSDTWVIVTVATDVGEVRLLLGDELDEARQILGVSIA